MVTRTQCLHFIKPKFGTIYGRKHKLAHFGQMALERQAGQLIRGCSLGKLFFMGVKVSQPGRDLNAAIRTFKFSILSLLF